MKTFLFLALSFSPLLHADKNCEEKLRNLEHMLPLYAANARACTAILEGNFARDKADEKLCERAVNDYMALLKEFYKLIDTLQRH